MRILVTGGLGTVGAGLVPDLRRRGHHVVSCDIAHQPDEFAFSVPTDVIAPLYARCDVGEFRQIERVIEQPASDHRTEGKSKDRWDWRWRSLAWLVVWHRAVENKVARRWHVCGWRGSRSFGCARNLRGADATGSGARTHQATTAPFASREASAVRLPTTGLLALASDSCLRKGLFTALVRV
jgi:hypothetical protein